MIPSPNQNSIEAREPVRPGADGDFLRRHAFHLSVGAFILLSAFLYGISAGLRKHSGRAFAGYSPIAADSGAQTFTRLVLPPGVAAAPLGHDVLINNHPAEVASFVSRRPAADLVERQMEIWRAAGMKVIGKAGERRGIALAFNESAGERYSFSAWTVPPGFRDKLSGGNPTQGFMSVADSQQPNGAQAGSDGTVPDVPLMPGGKGGAVYSAVDPVGRTYSGAYTNPGGVDDNMEYYRSELSSSGWREMNENAAQPDGAQFEVGNLLFQRAGEEVVLLFTPAQSGAAADPQTVVAVTRGPLAIERWRAPQ